MSELETLAPVPEWVIKMQAIESLKTPDKKLFDDGHRVFLFTGESPDSPFELVFHQPPMKKAADLIKFISAGCSYFRNKYYALLVMLPNGVIKQVFWTWDTQSTIQVFTDILHTFNIAELTEFSAKGCFACLCSCFRQNTANTSPLKLLNTMYSVISSFILLTKL